MDTCSEMLTAVKSGDFSMVESLLESHPELANCKDDSDISCCMQATYFDHDEIVELLLQHGAVLNIFEASATGKVEFLGELLEKDPDSIHSFSPDGWTPLHLAGYFGRLDAVKLLLHRGANIKAISKNDLANTPLHSSIAAHQSDAAEMIVKSGADANAPMGDGSTALHLAAHAGDDLAANLLLMHGASPTVQNEAGITPLELAVAKGHQDLADKMRRRIAAESERA